MERCNLKKIMENEVDENYVSWLNNPAVTKYLDTKMATLQSCREYVANHNTDCSKIFWIMDDDKKIGTVTLSDIDFKTKTAVVGIMIGDTIYWNKGFGSVALELISDYAKDLGLDVLKAGVIRENIGSINCFKKAGFKIKREIVTMEKKLC
jgi:ribosomal-protein-alanine N-acetyltransferase